MPTLLHVNASPRGAQSSSLALARTFLDEVVDTSPETKVDTLDLFDDPLPAFGSAAAAAKYAAFAGQSPSDEGAEAWAQARAFFDRFAAADAYLFNVPMWNHGVPYALKQLVDVITQPGWAFGFDPATGYTGLVTGRAAVIHTSGVWAPGVGREFGVDLSSTYVEEWLHFVGITDVRSMRHAGNALSTTPEADLARAHEQARALAAGF